MLAERAAQDVERGAALLDAHEGQLWDEKVRLPELEILSPLKCVLGFVRGAYSEGLKAYGLDALSAYDFGFTALGDFEYAQLLNQAWRELITKRRIERYAIRAEQLNARVLA